ncbi:MAG: hypothetical protein ABIS50_03675 [Luteolibacter sp.]|uniref:hypothetical protein n=1 Tax=Luteolibacter sp. TaxID=1962973 RepID=UPI0032650706
MPDIDSEAVKKDIEDLAANLVAEHKEVAVQEGMALLADSSDRLARYSEQLAQGLISEDQLREDLSLDLLALAGMEGLKQKGLEQIRLAAFANGVVTVLVGATIRSVTGGIL